MQYRLFDSEQDREKAESRWLAREKRRQDLHNLKVFARQNAKEHAEKHNSGVFVADITDKKTWRGEFTEGSVDVIITDPPYPKEYIHLMSDLSKFARYVLKDGGDLFVMMGQSYLSEVMRRLESHMMYYWTMCYLMPAHRVWMYHRKTFTNWKPVLWYTKGLRCSSQPFVGGDVIQSPYTPKMHHKWEQGYEGIEEWVLRCSDENAVVCDPFCGSGTTLLACQNLGRPYIGFDIDPGAVSITQKRLEEEV